MSDCAIGLCSYNTMIFMSKVTVHGSPPTAWLGGLPVKNLCFEKQWLIYTNITRTSKTSTNIQKTCATTGNHGYFIPRMIQTTCFLKNKAASSFAKQIQNNLKNLTIAEQLDWKPRMLHPSDVSKIETLGKFLPSQTKNTPYLFIRYYPNSSYLSTMFKHGCTKTHKPEC